MKYFLILLCALIMSSVAMSQSQRTIDEPTPSRQVHLDFHTSEYIPDIGKKFDKKQFQQALKTGHVNSINIFAKGHHGWSYYPTKVGNMHPNLDFDLLKAQIEACREIGVKVFAYYTVGWSAHDVEVHPEWAVVRKDGSNESGEMDRSTYENIGYAFDYVEKIEDYGIEAKTKAATGLYIGEDLPAIEGTAQMLLERHVNFDVVNTLEDWSDIETLVITSGGVLPKDVPKIQAFVKRGGKVLAMGEGIFVDGKPIIDIGATYLGKATYDVDYTIAKDSVGTALVSSPFLNYTAALRVQPKAGTEVLATLREPYFSRTLEHYSSHKNTPYKLTDADHPAVIRNGNIIFMAHDLDRQYKAEGAQLHRDLFYNALQLLRKKPFITTEMPSMGRINLLHQPEQHRYVAHLLYASPIQRGSVRVIEDLVPLYDVPLTVDLPEKITEVYLVPSGEILKTEKVDGKLKVVIPKLQCHIAVVFEYTDQ